MPLDRTLLPCSLHPLHTCSVLFSPFPPLQSPPWAGVRAGLHMELGWDELCSTHVLCPCLLSLSPVARAPHSCCVSLQLPDCCLFVLCVTEGSVLPLGSREVWQGQVPFLCPSWLGSPCCNPWMCWAEGVSCSKMGSLCWVEPKVWNL